MNITHIKKGSTVFLSTIGHKGFFYPSEKYVSILYDADCSSIAWVGGQSSKTPVIIPESAVFISGCPSKNVAVWVPNE